MNARLFLVRLLALLGLLGFIFFLYSLTVDTTLPTMQSTHVYSVWGLPPEDVTGRLKNLMTGLRSEFGGPKFEPHVTVVGAISLTEDDARSKFREACAGLKAYQGVVDRVASGTFFYQCIYLLLHPTEEVVKTSEHCCAHFGYKSNTSYMPHLSLLYEDLTDEEKNKAREKAKTLDQSIEDLKFPITQLALYQTDTEDKTERIMWRMNFSVLYYATKGCICRLYRSCYNLNIGNINLQRNRILTHNDYLITY